MQYKIRLHFTLLFRYFVFVLAFFSNTTALCAQEPNQTDNSAVRMLHVFIQADTDIVRFDNIWVLGRETNNEPWQVAIDLPKGADLFRMDDPNSAVVSEDGQTLDVNLSANSLIDSVGFSYLLPNHSGQCMLDIIPRYKVESAIISVSGTATGFSSKVLSASKFRQERSRFSRVYVANSVPANTPIDLNLSSLPYKGSFPHFLRIISIVGLVLILALAGGTMYRYPKLKIEDSVIHEAGSK